MKNKKLILSRETLRNLKTTDLAKVHGGLDDTALVCVSRAAGCPITHVCPTQAYTCLDTQQQCSGPH